MTNQDLIAKLNDLRSTEPNSTWLQNNRELLLSQISNSGGQNLPAWRITLITFSSLAKTLSQPAMALGAFMLLLFGGSLFGAQLFAQTKPNDSLYIARIISEKVKLNTTFDLAKRDKLEVKYASEHAQAISDVLADPSFNNQANESQVAKLNNSFNEEVNTVKNKIGRVQTSALAKSGNDDSASLDVAIADNSKDGQGIQLFENFTATASTSTSTAELSVTSSGSASSTASSTLSASSTPKVDVVPVDAGKILDEAQKLFDSKDYNKASEKLKEVDSIIK